MLPSGSRLGFALVLAISLTQQPQSALGAAPPAAPEVPATVQPPPPETREDTPLPTAEEIATRLKAIQEDPTIAAELKAQLVEVITDLAKQLPEINQHQQRRETLAAGAAAAPEELAKAQRLKEAPPGSARPPLPPLRTLAEVRAKKEEINSQLESNIQQQQAIEAELRKRDERRKSLPQLLVDTRTRLQKLESEPPPAPDSVVDPRLQQARQDLRRARLKAARAELASLQQESKTYEAEADLLPLRRELLVREVQQLKEVIQQLTKYLSNQRNFDIEKHLPAFTSVGSKQHPARSG